VEGLVSLVQFGVLEIHPWGARNDDLEHPDMLTFDLDPGEGVGFAAVRDAAVGVRDILDAVKLKSFVKTSGGKGLHVCVPIRPESSWEEAKSFAKAVAEHMAAQDPKRYIATMSKAQRTGKIFIDYLRNGRGATSVAPYSTRARQNAPISMPLRWNDLAKLKSADAFTLQTAMRGQGKAGKQGKGGPDPWTGYFVVDPGIPDGRGAGAAAR
jgi:bifunctional non-homologous end joining protein LigD